MTTLVPQDDVDGVDMNNRKTAEGFHIQCNLPIRTGVPMPQAEHVKGNVVHVTMPRRSFQTDNMIGSTGLHDLHAYLANVGEESRFVLTAVSVYVS